MSLESNKTLGGIGAILLAIPFTNIVGIILVLLAMKGMADYYNDDDIFKNTLYGFIFGVVSVIALIGVILMLAFGSLAVTPYEPYVVPFAGFGIVILVFVVLYVFSLIAAIFYQKALNILKEKSGEPMFQTAGLVLLIGAIIPVIGEILKLIAWILAAVGFFSVRSPSQPLAPRSAPMPPQPHTSPTSTSEEKRFCRHCGAQIQLDAAFCSKCGSKVD